MSKKLFVGGYYDDRIFNGIEEKTPFSKCINTYTLEEVLKLGFVENVIEWHEEDDENERWENISDNDKIDAILTYVENDEIAGLLYFETEDQAEKFKNDTIKEVEDLEKDIEYAGKQQDTYGNFREVYEIVKNL